MSHPDIGASSSKPANSAPARQDRAALIASASVWLERVLDDDVESSSRTFAHDPGSRRAARLVAARALSRIDPDSPSIDRVRTALVRDQRSDGGFDAAHAAVAPDAVTTASCVEILALSSRRTPALDQALSRAIERLKQSAISTAVVRALVAIESGPETLTHAAQELESEFETHALQPLAETGEAADRLHAWHAAAGLLSLDFRRHPAVQQCTLALIQRTEASAGEVHASYAKDGRITGRRADAVTAIRTALALFSVTDAIVGPRAAFAADLVIDAWAVRATDGAVRSTGSRFAKRSVIATALFVEALHASQVRSRRPWMLPTAPPIASTDSARRELGA